MERREFLKKGMVLGGSVAASGVASSLSAGDAAGAGMMYRDLGRTGVKVSAIGLGGFHLGNPRDESLSIRIIRTAIDRGVTFMDNCWDYHNGDSEVRMGKALGDGYRKRVFLMTKIDGRSRQTAARQIDESLRRLRTDVIDLMQIHEVIRLEDPDRVFEANGAIHALEDARKAGKIRFIGFTGHKDPYVHLRMLETARLHGFRFDTVQMPLNVMDAHFRSFGREVLPVLVREQIGVLGMKPMGSGLILQSKTVTAPECLRYALSLPTSVVITGIDSMELLDQALNVVKGFRPMTENEIAALLARTKQAALTGQFERFKTGNQFDSTAKNPAWTT